MSTRAAPPAEELHLTKGGSVDLDAVTKVMNAAFDDRFGEAWTRSQCAGILPMPGVELVLARDGDGEAAWPSARNAMRLPEELRTLPPKPIYARAPDARARNAA